MKVLCASASSLGRSQTFKRKVGAGDGMLIPIKNSVTMFPIVLETGCCYGLTGCET